MKKKKKLFEGRLEKVLPPFFFFSSFNTFKGDKRKKNKSFGNDSHI